MTRSTLGALRALRALGVLALLACGGGALVGCASAPPTAHAAATAPTHTPAPTQTAELPPWLLPHLEDARAKLAAHGLALPPAVKLVVHDETRSFVAATGQSQPALRAWTGFGRVDLLHPRLWGDDSPATRSARLTHELCHAALLGFFVDENAAATARIPRFFSEGACSVVAGQQRNPVAEVVAGAAGALPLTIDTFERDPDLAYGASHALAELLVQTHGPRVFARVMELAVRDGSAGCVERALLQLTDARDIPALWQRVVDSAPHPASVGR